MNQTTTTLYERLGRREGITRITADLMKNHLANPLVNARYMNSEDLARVERRAVEFFCAGTGGPADHPATARPRDTRSDQTLHRVGTRRQTPWLGRLRRTL